MICLPLVTVKTSRKFPTLVRDAGNATVAITFRLNPDGTLDFVTWSVLFTANADGSGVHQITHPPRRVLDIVPNLSRPGRRTSSSVRASTVAGLRVRRTRST
jgi:hypothetical protein